MSATVDTSSRTTATGPGLTTGTLVAGLLAVCLAQIGLAIPATLNGLFQTDLHPVGSQLTWISDAFLLPVAVLELTFGLLGDLFGRKRLLVGGAALLAVGELVSTTASGIHQLWVGQALAGLGAAALFPTSLAILAAGTTSPRSGRGSSRPGRRCCPPAVSWLRCWAGSRPPTARGAGRSSWSP
ncbi:MFS transporter [Streptacidiphilus monticola]